MKVIVGQDEDVIGSYVLREGRIDIEADTDSAKASLDERLELYYNRLFFDEKVPEAEITAERLLNFIGESSTQGRSWTKLEA